MGTITKDLGIATAYGYAKSKGYTGTEEEFAELMADYAEVAEEAKEYSETSEAYAKGTRNGSDVSSSDPAYHNNSKYYAEQADGYADSAGTSASTATDKAGEASASAASASASATTATTKAGEATSAAASAASSASAAGTSETNAAASAGTASTAATNAASSASAAQAAQAAAETAQGKAEDAQEAAEAAQTAAEAIEEDISENYGSLVTDVGNIKSGSYNVPNPLNLFELTGVSWAKGSNSVTDVTYGAGNHRAYVPDAYKSATAGSLTYSIFAYYFNSSVNPQKYNIPKLTASGQTINDVVIIIRSNKDITVYPWLSTHGGIGATSSYAVGDSFLAREGITIYKPTFTYGQNNSGTDRPCYRTLFLQFTTPATTSDLVFDVYMLKGSEIYEWLTTNVKKTDCASSAEIKSGIEQEKYIAPVNQDASAFYALAKAAGDTTQSASSNAVGTYTEDAKRAICTMIGVPYDEPFRLIKEITITEETRFINITTDESSSAFSLTEAVICFDNMVATGSGTGYILANREASASGLTDATPMLNIPNVYSLSARSTMAHIETRGGRFFGRGLDNVPEHYSRSNVTSNRNAFGVASCNRITSIGIKSSNDYRFTSGKITVYGR